MFCHIICYILSKIAAIWHLSTMELTEQVLFFFQTTFLLRDVIPHLLGQAWLETWASLNAPSWAAASCCHQGAPVAHGGGSSLFCSNVVARMSLPWSDFCDLITKPWTQKPHDCLTFNVNDRRSSEAQFNFYTRIKKTFTWLFCRSSAALLCHVNINIKQRSPLIFVVVVVVVDSYLWALIRHWLKTWPDPFIARIVYQFLRMCAVNSRWGKQTWTLLTDKRRVGSERVTEVIQLLFKVAPSSCWVFFLRLSHSQRSLLENVTLKFHQVDFSLQGPQETPEGGFIEVVALLRFFRHFISSLCLVSTIIVIWLINWPSWSRSDESNRTVRLHLLPSQIASSCRQVRVLLFVYPLTAPHGDGYVACGAFKPRGPASSCI